MKWLFTAKDVFKKEVRLINENSETKTFTIKYEWNDGNDDKELFQYLRNIFDFHDTKDSSELNRPGDDLLISVKLEEILKPADYPQPQQFKEYDNVWPVSINFGDLDFTSSESTMKGTVMNRAELEEAWKDKMDRLFFEMYYGNLEEIREKLLDR
jgi:hypothetical protein